MKRLVIVISLALAFSARAYTISGTTITTDGSQSDVQAGINAAGDGYTVVVPAITTTWSQSVDITHKSITLQGAGPTQTVITGGVVATLTASNFVTISGFQFSTAAKAQWGFIYIEGQHGSPVPQFRITNCQANVAPLSGSVIGTRGIGIVATYGVIDHCLITNHSQNGQGVSLFDDSQVMLPTVTWFNPQPLGTKNAVVVEDCTFDFDALSDGAFDCYDGTKIVFRHNTVINTCIGWHGADSEYRSMRSFEIYNNTFQTDSRLTSSTYTAIRSRGGTGVVWGNTITGAYNDFFILSEYRADSTYASTQSAAGPLGSDVDGNFDATHYPLLDQTGRGSFPSNTPWPNQSFYTPREYESLRPMYQWGNNFHGNTSPTCTVDLPVQSQTYIKPGRDYYDNTMKPGYVPLAYPYPLTP